MDNITILNSQVIIGKYNDNNNNNIYKENLNSFDVLREKIIETIKNEKDKQNFVDLVDCLENNKNDKHKFKEAYDNFIAKLGSYMSILSPFISFLIEYLPH